MQPATNWSAPPVTAGLDPLQKRSIFWSLVGVAMLIAIALIFAWTLKQVNDSDHLVDHTREVIHHNRQLLSDVKDAESAERGYIITGDESYLEGYRASSADIDPISAKLEQLIADNPPQLARLKNLENLIVRRMAVMNQALDERRTEGFNASLAVVLAGKGRIETMRIRDASRISAIGCP